MSPTHGQTLMDGRPTAPESAAGALGRLGALFGRRRAYLVDPAFQLRSALVAILGMVFVLVFAFGLFRLLTVENARLMAQRGGGIGGAADPADVRTLLALIAAGLLFVGAAFAVQIVETHRTAGAALRLTRGLRDLASGRWAARLALRRHDNLGDVAEAFNAAAEAVREACDRDRRALDDLEGRLGLAAREIESGNREGALLLLRGVTGEVRSLSERKGNLLNAAPGALPTRRTS